MKNQLIFYALYLFHLHFLYHVQGVFVIFRAIKDRG